MNDSTAKTTTPPPSPRCRPEVGSQLRDDPYLQELLGIFAEFFEGFGFKPNLGRIWTVLFYSVEPLSQKQLMRTLGLSAGMVSQGLHELTRFGMVRAKSAKQRRETLYETERNLTKIVASILGKRESQIVARLMQRVDHLKQRLAVSQKNAEFVTSRIDGLDQVLVICALAQAIIHLVETFSHYSYHAVSLGTRALAKLKVPQLPKFLNWSIQSG